MMGIRKAVANDHQWIRTLQVSLTGKPMSAILPKHFRVLVQEAAARLLVFDENNTVSAFIALRLIPAQESGTRFLTITHFGLDHHDGNSDVAVKMEVHACLVAQQQLCKAVLVKAEKLSAGALHFYKGRGYLPEPDFLIKQLA